MPPTNEKKCCTGCSEWHELKLEWVCINSECGGCHNFPSPHTDEWKKEGNYGTLEQAFTRIIVLGKHRIDPEVEHEVYKFWEDEEKKILSALIEEIIDSRLEAQRVSIAGDERKYWVKVFDSKPERTREYPCDNCTQNIARIEIDRWDKTLSASIRKGV